MNLGKESEILEFKESTGELHQGIESIAAMLNKHGYGELYFGVCDNGEVKGQDVQDSTIKVVTDGILRDLEPRITPTVVPIDYEGKTVLKVSFSGSDVPYSAFGNFLTRVGATNRKMPRSELIRLVKRENYSSGWESLTSEHSLDDVDEVTLKKYYEEATNCGRLTMGEYNRDALLSTLELVRDGKLKNAGYALFGRDAQIGLKLACYATDKKVTFTDLNLMKGNIYNLINEASTYILNHINWRVEIERKRIEIPEIPVKAIREIVVNAFAHALYDATPEIEIGIHPNKITIFNPGSFPPDLTPYDYINKTLSSVKRNPLILDVLYRCKDVEKSGTGFQRMEALCKGSHVKWSFDKEGYGFMFVFYRETENIAPIAPMDDLTEQEKIIYEMIKEDPKITREEIVSKVQTSLRTVQRVTNSLARKGYILRIGSNRFGYWELVERKE